MSQTPKLSRKRLVSLGPSATPGSVKRARPGGLGGQEADVVLVSSDGQRFPFSTRLLLASSPIWADLLPPPTASLPPYPRPASPSPSTATSSTADGVDPSLPEVRLPESAACLAFVLRFLEPVPLGSVREAEFPRDWETVRALDRYSIWRGIDAFTSSFSGSSIPPSSLAPAFAFSRLFRLPSLSRSSALQIAKHVSNSSQKLEEVLEGLRRAREEWGEAAGEGTEKLLAYLLHRSTALSSLRSSALKALRSFDDAYDCEHSCRGMVYANLVTLLNAGAGAGGRKKVKRVEREVEFDCKDCDERWDRVVEIVKEGLKKVPDCPFGEEEEDDDEDGEDETWEDAVEGGADVDELEDE
ncbi:hypothetical protein JCM8097_004340 [Rhodosporidiobolus ruineniae]